MGEDTHVGVDALTQRFQCPLSAFIYQNIIPYFMKNPVLCLVPRYDKTRKTNVPQEINALVEFSDRNLPGMQSQLESFSEEFVDGFYDIQTVISLGVQYHKVVGITDIVFFLQLVLHKLVELIEIDIGKKLRCQVPDWQTLRIV